MFFRTVRAKVFWMVSRFSVTAYGQFPIFGAIRGTAAVIKRGDRYVVIERNDGYGMCFPGGIAKPWETEEQAVRREVCEETGLELGVVEFKFRFRSNLLYPTVTNVFVAEATGTIKSSWEGTAQLATLEELERKIMETQRPVVEYLKTGVIPV